MKNTTVPISQVLIIFGDIDFNNDIAAIHKIYDVLLLPANNDDEAINDICEKTMEAKGYDTYIIPQWYAGEVIFKT